MSGSQTPPGPTAGATSGGTGGSDPSMEDILASIRRILSEDEVAAPAAPPPAEARPAEDGVLVLDPAMMVPDPANEAVPLPQARLPEAEEQPVAAQLVAPETEAAAASSIEGLVRALTERTTRVHSSGPTIEDLVREELRPLLKSWLNTNLAPLVERLVRAEIERVVGRAVP